MSKELLTEMKKFVAIAEGLSTNRTRVEFEKPVAIKAVNMINARMKKYGQPNRAFLIDKSTIEMDVPAGIEVDIADGVMDELGGGMYGSVWGSVAEESPVAEKTCSCEGVCECGTAPMPVMEYGTDGKETACSSCGGKGNVDSVPCETCDGAGLVPVGTATNKDADFMHDIQLESVVDDVLGESPNLKRVADMYRDEEGHYDVDTMSDELGDEVSPSKKPVKKMKDDDEELDGLRFG